VKLWSEEADGDGRVRGEGARNSPEINLIAEEQASPFQGKARWTVNSGVRGEKAWSWSFTVRAPCLQRTKWQHGRRQRRCSSKHTSAPLGSTSTVGWKTPPLGARSCVVAVCSHQAIGQHLGLEVEQPERALLAFKPTLSKTNKHRSNAIKTPIHRQTHRHRLPHRPYEPCP